MPLLELLCTKNRKLNDCCKFNAQMIEIEMVLCTNFGVVHENLCENVP